LQEAYNKALEDFNLNRSAKLSKINDKGKALKAELGKHQDQLPLYETNLTTLANSIADHERQIEEITKVIDSIQNSLTSIEDNPEYQAKLQEKAKLVFEVSDLQQGNQTAKDDIQTEINRLDVAIKAMESSLLKIDQREDGIKRIDELMEQEKTLATEYEKLEGELFLTEQFIKTKVNLLEEKINSKFKLARFKLFEVQVNGGLNEVCETTYNGVPTPPG
jgi:chromosome segregation ATPase